MTAFKAKCKLSQFVGLVFFASLTACSGGDSGTPSESMAREWIETNFIKHPKLEGAVKIESFVKTNGLKRNENGVEQYLFEYKMELSFPRGFHPECLDKSHYNQKCFDWQLNGGSPRPVGAKELDNGKILFEKAEKGWRPVGRL